MSDYEQDFTQLFARGLCMISEGEYEEAVRLFDQVLDIEPVFSAAYVQRGYAKFHLDQIEESLDDLNRAIEFSPDSVDAFAFRARSYWMADRPEDAFRDISYALELDPKNLHALHVRAFINMEVGNFAEAIADYDNILEDSSDDEDALQMRGWAKLYFGQPESALQDNDVLLELDPYEGKHHFQRTIIFGALQQYENVLTSANEAVRYHYSGKRPPTYYMAWALLSLKRHDEALTCFQELLEAEENSQVLYGMAVTHGKLGAEEQSLAKLLEAARVAGEHEDELNKRFFEQLIADWSKEKSTALPIIEADVALRYWHAALAAMQAENHDEAMCQFAEALRYNPLIVGAYANMATVCQEQGLTEEALEAIEKALVFSPGTESYLYHKGLILLDLERYAEAVAIFDRLIEGDPVELASYYQRARGWYYLNETEKAIDDLSLCCREGSNNEAALMFRAACYRVLEQFDKAIDDYSRVIYYNPDNIGALHLRATVYEEETEKYEEVIRDESRVLEINANYQPAWLLRGRAWGAISLQARRAKSAGQKLPVEMTDLFEREYFDERECLDRALSDLTRAVELAPDDLETIWVRGYYRYRAQDYLGTIEDFSRIVAEDASNASAHHWTGWAKISLCRYEEAVEAFDKALAINPNDGDTYYARGIAKQNLRRFAEAEKDLKTAWELDPSDAYAVHYYAHALEWQGRFEESLEPFEKSLDLNHDAVEWYCCFADVLIKLGRVDEAIEQLNHSIMIDPHQSQPYFYLGELHENANEQGRAIEYYHLAIRSEDPAQRSYRESEEINLTFRGKALAATGQHEKAIERYWESLKLSPMFHGDDKETDDLRHHAFGMAESYYALGRFPEALKQYRIALDYLVVYHDREERIARCRERIETLEKECGRD